MDARTLWTDARLDDFSRDVSERLRALASTNERLGVIDRDLNELRDDLRETRQAIVRLAEQFAKRGEAREQERKERDKARKVDRRWLIGTVFTAALLVVGAAGVLVQVLQ